MQHMEPIRGQYNDISEVYDLLTDGDDGGLFFRMHVEKFLEDLPKKARILDCSCGTGNHAIWLARQGYRVSASDISEGMLEQARKKAAFAKLPVEFYRSSWEDQHHNVKQAFDMVLCPGNSLSHIGSISQITEIARSMRRILKPGSPFVYDIRNWEKTMEEDNLHTQEFRVGKGEKPWEVRYSYDIRGWNKPSKMFVDIRPAGETQYQHHRFDFLPAGFEQFKQAFLQEGFTSFEREFYLNEEYYLAIAR